MHEGTLPHPFSRTFAFERAALTFTTDDPWSAEIVASAFEELRGRGADLTRTHAAIGVRAGGLHASFESRSCFYPFDNSRFGAAYNAVRDVFAAFTSHATRQASFYGASLSIGGKGIALFGAPAVGKTVLLLHLERLGASFLGDESLAVNLRTQFLRAVPRLPALREPALVMLPPGLSDSVRRSPRYASQPLQRFWYALAASDLCGIRPNANPRRLHAAVFAGSRAATPALQEISQAELLNGAVAKLYDKPRALDHLARIRTALRDTRAFALTIGDPRSTAELLMERLSCE